MTDWNEEEHPRVPKGSGDKSGQFTSKESIEQAEKAAQLGAGLTTEDEIAYKQMVELFNKRSAFDAAKAAYERNKILAEGEYRRLSNEPSRRHYYDDYLKKKDEAWSKKETLLAEIKSLEKHITPLTDGNWRDTLSETGNMASTTRIYNNDKHPEWGDLEINLFKGYTRQRVAPSAAVSFGGGKYSWNGQNSRDQMNRFLKKYFGTSR